MNEVLTFNELLQWGVKIGTVAGIYWVFIQAKTARENQHKEESDRVRQTELKDQQHDNDIAQLRKDFERREKKDKEITDVLKEIAVRLTKIETILEFEDRSNN